MLILNSPAKINLFLKIVEKRADGYHNLASLFQTISLMDRLSISIAEQDKLTCTDPTIPTDGSNLVMKAVELFRSKTGSHQRFSIHLEKHIPNQAGLGGGSGNAATTLWALNQLTKEYRSDEKLAEWAAEIGSDISFFFSQGTAYCTGRGEQVQNVQIALNPTLWILKPDFGLSTPDVYRHLKLEELPHRDPQSSLMRFQLGEWDLFNDLELPAFKIMPQLQTLKKEFYDLGFSQVAMSGSGTAFFCIGQPNHTLPALFCQQARFIKRQAGHWYVQ